MKEKIVKHNRFIILALTSIIAVFLWVKTMNCFIADSYALKGMKSSATRDYYAAESYYKKSLKHDTGNGKTHFQYGSLLLNTGKIKDGITELNIALANFKDIYLYRNLGKAYLKVKEYDKAREYYEKTLDTGIFFLDSLCDLGTVYLNKGKNERAIEIFNKALSYNNDHLLAIKNIGIAYLNNGNYQEAITPLRRAAVKEPSNARLLNSLGIAYLKAGNPMDAIRTFNRVIKVDKNNLTAHNNLGSVYYEKKEYYKAREYWKRTLQIDPNNKVAKHNIRKVKAKLLK